MPLRKIFPFIIALISLSLVGIVFIEYYLLRNMLQGRREDISWQIATSVSQVSQELYKESAGLPSLKSLRSVPGFNLPSAALHSELMRPMGVAQQYTEIEITERLRTSFREKGFINLQFEFAIINNTLLRYEMRSKGYEGLLQENTSDSVRNLVYFCPIQPAGGSEWENLAPNEDLSVIVPNPNRIVLKQMRGLIISATFFTVLIAAAFFITLYALVRQKKISEIKNDFINNMTHEFKTPIATISLAVDALKNEKVVHNPERMQYFREIIKEENKRMNKHVETILQSAVMDRQELQLAKVPLQVHELIRDVVSHHRLQLEEKNSTTEVLLDAKQDVVQADPEHFRNMLSNLVDNAIKYANDGLQLRIATSNNRGRLQVRVADNGIGMTKETIRRIFEKFYRAHTGNLHNVKGFGLGLSYVKSIVDAHNGKIRVESTPGKGSEFILEFPLA